MAPRAPNRARYRRDTSTIKGSALRLPSTAAIAYNKAIQPLIDQMVTEVTAELTKLFESPQARRTFVHAADASISTQSDILLGAMTNRFKALFSKAAGPIAQSMVDKVTTNSETGLANSLRDIAPQVTLQPTVLTSAGPVAKTVAASVGANVDLITSIPTEFLAGVKDAVLGSIATGNGLADLQPYLEQHHAETKRRAQLIALDQTRKTYNALNAARMQEVGISKYEWVHSGGSQKPRPLHVEMNGNVYSFDNPPIIDIRTGERGIPGQAINCRCTMRPILDFGNN